MAQPDRQCDVVMRGGIASGIVYPTAIAELSKSYRFRSIGGTSAGAIAAVAAAAAEFGRREGREGDPFAELAAVPSELAVREKGRSKLYRLFQPQRETAALHRIFSALLDSMGRPMLTQFVWVVSVMMRSFWGSCILATLPMLVVCFLLAYSSSAVEALKLPLLFQALVAVGLVAGLGIVLLGALLTIRRLWAVVVAGLVVAATVAAGFNTQLSSALGTFGTLLALVFMLYVSAGAAVFAAVYRTVQTLRSKVPANGYGICTGVDRRKKRRRRSQQHLIDWLHTTVQSLSGKGVAGPLTVGDLRQAHLSSAERAETSIELALMTTDITRGMSHCFPQIEGADGWRGQLYFVPEDLDRLLPEEVVSWIRAKSPTPDGVPDIVDAAGHASDKTFYRLPAPDDLPVLFGARLSMSFPLLLSAVPLYTPTPSDAAPGKVLMRRCWFSDGGLTSNFPIHFFDSPIPRRPTFGISLAEGDYVGDPGRRIGKDNPVVMLSSRSTELLQRFNDFEGGGGVGGFVSAAFEASRNWSDTELMNMPGYRERIVHVVLEASEGGLNLDMPPDVIANIASKGQMAGARIRQQFGEGSEWDDYRWVRYRSFMASLEGVAKKFHQRWANPVGASSARVFGGTHFAELVKMSERRVEPFPWAAGQFKDAGAATEEFVRFGDRFNPPGGLASDIFDRTGEPTGAGQSPRPKPRLKMMPPDDSELPQQR